MDACVIQNKNTIKDSTKHTVYPLIMAFLVVLVDQITKVLVVRHIDYLTVGASYFDGLIRIIHARNPAIAFSIGAGLPDNMRLVLFTVIPLIILIVLFLFYLRYDKFTFLQRWAVAGIMGGGVGNLIDRIIRPEGVVDFIDVAFFGIFGLERWPTFNVADAVVVVSGILLMITMVIDGKENNEQES